MRHVVFSAVVVSSATLVGAVIFAPFAEEPWLRRHLGAVYDEYVKSSPRYLGFRRGAAVRSMLGWFARGRSERRVR
jgi:protein-S-isoprenylcysteine O-methyltransferase Ste14